MDDRATAEAFERYAPVVYARCMRLLRHRESARDITQEVFVRCVRERRSLRPGRELLAWLYRVATNLCLNALRDQKLRSEMPSGAEEELRAPPTNPDRRLLLRVLEGLDPRTQAIAVYVHVDGMTQAEAAQIAGVTDRTVRNCLARFLAHARERLQDADPDTDEKEEESHDRLSVRLQSGRP